MSHSDIITAQYVKIAQTPAGLGDRILARCIDYAIIVAYAISMVKMLGLLTDIMPLPVTTSVIIVWLPCLLYTFVFEFFWHGQTPGKRIRHIRVVQRDGSRPGIGSIFLRWVCELVDIACSGVGIIFIAFTRHGQRLGDLAAGTQVIHMARYQDYHVSLDDFNHLRYDYQPVYPEAARLSPGQADLISRTLYAPAGYEPAQVDRLADKVRSFLHHDPADIPTSNADYLVTILHDFQYYELALI